MLTEHTAPIVGARFRPPAADVLNNLAGDTALLCIRQPDNPHDANAIKVCCSLEILEEILELMYSEDERPTVELESDDTYHLGYVPKTLAEILAPYIDKMGGRCTGKLQFTLEGRPAVVMEIEDEEAGA